MDVTTFNYLRTELYNGTVQAPFTLDATFLSGDSGYIATTSMVADPKQLAYTRSSEMYHLDRSKNTLTRLPFETKNDPDTLAQAIYTKDTSRKAYMVKTTGIKAGYRLEINDQGVRTHTVEINTPDYLKYIVPDLTVKPCLVGPKAFTPHGNVCHVPNLVD
jgi:hypothetical protein